MPRAQKVTENPRVRRQTRENVKGRVNTKGQRHAHEQTIKEQEQEIRNREKTEKSGHQTTVTHKLQGRQEVSAREAHKRRMEEAARGD